MPIHEFDVLTGDGGQIQNLRALPYTSWLDGPATSVTASSLGSPSQTLYIASSTLARGERAIFHVDTSGIPVDEEIVKVDVQVDFSVATTATRLVAAISPDTNTPVNVDNWDSRAEMAAMTKIGEFKATGVTGRRTLDVIDDIRGKTPGINRSGITHVHFILGYHWDEIDPGEVSLDEYSFTQPSDYPPYAKLIVHTRKPSSGVIGDVF